MASLPIFLFYPAVYRSQINTLSSVLLDKDINLHTRHRLLWTCQTFHQCHTWKLSIFYMIVCRRKKRTSREQVQYRNRSM